MRTTIVQRTPASDVQSTGSWPTARARSSPCKPPPHRDVSPGSPPPPERHRRGDAPGTTSTLTPAARRACASSPPRPNTNGSPPFGRPPPCAAGPTPREASRSSPGVATRPHTEPPTPRPTAPARDPAAQCPRCSDRDDWRRDCCTVSYPFRARSGPRSRSARATGVPRLRDRTP